MEEDIQKKLVSFCQYLPVHLELWKRVLQDLQSPVKGLVNFAEQLRYVEVAKNRYLEEFEEVQRQLGTKILEHIEDELQSTKLLVDKLNKSNHDLKNKLSTLERSTIDIDWGSDVAILKGTPLQPPLGQLLRMAYDFWVFFSGASKNMNSALKTVNIRDIKCMEEFEKVFYVNLGSGSKVLVILALTQYVINEKAVN